MTKTLFALLLVACSILGIFDAGYITYTKVTGQLPPCHPPFACGVVLRSSWAYIGPVPLSVLGLSFYAVMFSLSAAAVLEVSKVTLGKHIFSLPFLILMLGIGGAIFSLYLIFVMGVILKAWCFYCLISAINCMMIAILSVLHERKATYALHI